jgi:YD repeat-containing protein
MKSVKSFRANHISDLEENQIREKEFIHQFTQFDENGFPMEVTTYNPDGTVEHKYKYRYTSEGKVIDEMLLEADDEVTEHRSMVYDSDGKLSKEFIHYLDDSADVLIYTYDSEGRLISRRSIDNEGETGNYLVNVYSGKQLVSESEYDIAGEIITQRKIVYDENGKITEEIFRTPEQNYHILYSYDESGTASVSRKYNEDKHLTERNTFTYNTEGRLSESMEETSSGIEITYIKYDEAGNIILQEEKSEDGGLMSCIERTYDSSNRLLTTSVLSQRPGPNAPQHYRIRYEFED